jgi:hypothetical protein
MMPVSTGAHLGHPFEILVTKIGTAPQREDVGQARELFFDAAETVRIADEQQHAALDAAGQRHAKDGFEIETAVGEKRGDARHGAGMILDAQFENDVRRGRLASGGRSGRIWHGTRPALALRRWGNKNPLGAGQRGKLIFG